MGLYDGVVGPSLIGVKGLKILRRTVLEDGGRHCEAHPGFLAGVG